ncbi:MAG: baseplate J/gp47 family protein [Methylocystaceae bacterium]
MLPPLDQRDSRAIIQELKAMLPFYTPEWRFSPEDPDAGTALFLIFSRMLDGTIKRFNQVPRRNLAAFLNMMDISLLPACPAVSFLTFRLSSQDGESVLVPAGTQALANTKAGEQLVFETQSNLLVSPAVPIAIFNSSGEYDRVVELPAASLIDNPDASGQEFSLMDSFNGANLQQHSFYLGEADLLNIRGRASLELEVINSRQQFQELENSELLANPEYTEWSYYNGTGWQPFTEAAVKSNRIILHKHELGLIDFTKVNGVNSRWLCCRVQPGKIKALSNIEIDAVNIKAATLAEDDESSLVPELMFYNDIPLNVEDCYPMGEFFGLYDTFYLASEEAFSKKKADISISFKLTHEPHMLSNGSTPAIEWKMIMKRSALVEPEKPNIRIQRVVWEYWNGNGWMRLFKDSQYEDIFLQPSERGKTISFRCPEDMRLGMVNDQMNYWIRARVLSIYNLYAPNGVYQVPRMEKVQMSYRYTNESIRPTSFISLNNLEYHDLYQELKENKVNPAQPLKELDLPCPATYLGFEQPPLKGPISMFFSLRERSYDPDDSPALDWEYSSQSTFTAKWSKLEALDKTNNLSSSGLLVFGGPPDFTRMTIFGRSLYWMRVVNYDSKFGRVENRPVLPMVKGLYMNTTQVVQQENAASVMLSNPGGEAYFGFDLPRTPVVTEEVWVEEAKSLDEWEKQALLSDKNLIKRELRDDWGNLLELWVKWERVEDLSLSAVGARHYTMDRSSGRISFGDNQHGKIPPRDNNNNIEVRYWVGGGNQGNIAAQEINLLRDSLPYIDGVFNPQAACGGSDRESIDEAMRRGPQTLKNYGRAVTAEDFEIMAREVSRNVARVKCLPNTNWHGERESGCITLVVLPRGGITASLTFPALKQEVERYLYQRTSGNLLHPGKFQVIEPLYLEISAIAVLVTNNIDNMVSVETKALTKIREFLQPQSSDRGWNIGEYPHISVMYTLLKSISEVNYIENISMTVHKLVNGERIEIDPNQLNFIAHGYVLNGEHQVKVKVRS